MTPFVYLIPWYAFFIYALVFMIINFVLQTMTPLKQLKHPGKVHSIIPVTATEVRDQL